MNKINELKSELSSEWNKPKIKNLKRDSKGNIIDPREPRNYKRIKEIQREINNLKIQ